MQEDATGGWILGVDLGGTNIRSGVCDGEGAVRGWNSVPTPQPTTPESVVRAIAACCEESLSLAGVAREDVRLIGLGSPGPLDAEAGVVLGAPNLGWVDVPVAALLAEATGMDVRLENDALCAAIAEMRFGAGKGARSAFVLTLGTGVGGALIVDGRLVRGPDGSAGHLGHMVLDPDGPPLHPGNPGSVEAMCSATGLMRRAREIAEASEDAANLEVARCATGQQLYRCAVDGNPLAVGLFRDLGRSLGVLSASLANALNPEVGIFLGGLSHAWPLFAPEMEAELEGRALPVARRRLRLTRGTLGDEAGVLGAAQLAGEILT